MEVLKCANYVLVSMIEHACINLELVSSIVVTICKCQMLRCDNMYMSNVSKEVSCIATNTTGRMLY